MIPRISLKPHQIRTAVKILAGMSIAFWLSTIAINELYPYENPTVRRNLGNYMAERLQGLRNDPAQIVDALPVVGEILQWNSSRAADALLKQDPELKDAPVQEIAPGMYVRETEQVRYMEAAHDQIRWKEYSGIVDGKEVTISIPVDQGEPSPDIIDEILRQTVEN
ncbi:MAG: hypothetical protein N2691_02815 [Patescibacteria group bacterium]|nr:hypothetical protein [Patescibacteria group bacterium]